MSVDNLTYSAVEILALIPSVDADIGVHVNACCPSN